MNRKDFGEIVRALRKEQLDENYQPWTQAKLTKETSLSLEVIRRIERGQKKIIQEEELTLLADAFQLTSSERRQFFFASLNIAESKVPRRENDPETVLDMLRAYLSGVRQPAYVSDNYHDAVLANGSIVALLNLQTAVQTARTAPAGFNVARIGFDPDIGFLQLMGPDAERHAIYDMRYFRERTFLTRHTAYFNYVLHHLRKFRQFDRYWREIQYENGDYLSGNMTYAYEHPQFGPLHYVSVESVTLTGAGTLSTIIYVPKNENTTTVFELLARKCGTEVFRLAPWPDKDGLMP
ncbi:MAG: helix-turn-helix domain-containing protein [Anaerolineae bacterium]|nr:helix-turn-helix domain-containing protein [Anaerolineae bacterium]